MGFLFCWILKGFALHRFHFPQGFATVVWQFERGRSKLPEVIKSRCSWSGWRLFLFLAIDFLAVLMLMTHFCLHISTQYSIDTCLVASPLLSKPF